MTHGRPTTRREMLARCANGFGALALTSLLGEPAWGARRALDASSPRAPHFRPRARNVIFLYMDGGPSQVDTFDPKPRLAREHGQPIGIEVPRTQFADVGKVLQSPWAFRQHGRSGIWISELFPELSTCADELCVVRSMVAPFSEHAGANYFLHTGHGNAGRPSMGSWVSYGLGSENRDLPGFVVLDGGLVPPGGLDNFHSGFLPATFQGSMFRSGELPVANVQPIERTRALQQRKLELLRSLSAADPVRGAGEEELEAAIAKHELAFRMQSAVPELMELSGESAATRRLYGLDDEAATTRTYGSLCLLARRLVERGVRFVEITCTDTGHDRWDQHTKLFEGHRDNAHAVDAPVAGLLKDLRARGLLDTTLVVWAGEFGRTPMAQGADGRDHNPFGFTIWMAGGGARAGHVHGATDDYGYFAVEGKVTIYDLHATVLHLLGLDHLRTTVRFSGRDMRLTDVHGEVVHELIG